MSCQPAWGPIDWGDGSYFDHRQAIFEIERQEAERENVSRYLLPFYAEECLNEITEQEVMEQELARKDDEEAKAQKVKEQAYPFSPEEHEIWKLLGQVTKKMLALDQTHPSHPKEIENGIHTLQNVLGSRVLQRIAPKHWGSYRQAIGGRWVLRDGS